MSRTDSKVWLLLALTALAAAVAAATAWLVRADDRTLAEVGAIVAVIAIGVPAFVWLLRRLLSTATETLSLEAVADRLAVAVAAQWEKAAVERKLRYPAPVPVRWRWTNLPVAGPVIDAAGEATAPARVPPLPGMARVGQAALRYGEIRDLFRIYAGLDSSRLVILGRPGSGKSGAAILLVLDALTHRSALDDTRRARTPVPVLLTMHGWNPLTQPLTEWLATRLAQDYPFLYGGPVGRNTPARLISDGHLALVLDGLDEMPPGLRATAVKALNEQATFRLVLLSRSRELVEAVRYGHLAGAAPLELQPVNHSDAADYITRCQTAPLPDPWAKLVEHLHSDANSPVSHAMTTPLMLTLVRDTIAAPIEVEGILMSEGYSSHEQLEDALLDRVVPAAYTPRPGHPLPPWTVEQAQRWLGYLALRMNTDDTRDLAWWAMPAWLPKTLRAVKIKLAIHPQHPGPFQWRGVFTKDVLSGLAPGIGSALVLGVFFGPTAGLLYGLIFGIGAILMGGIFRPVTRVGSTLDPVSAWRQARYHVLMMGLTLGASMGIGGGAGLASGVVGIFGVYSTLGATGAFVIALVAGIVAGLAASYVGSSTLFVQLTFVQLRLSGKAPLRMLRFLEDARARHVLRTSGPVYQFRHARLQDRLAEAYASSGQGVPASTPEQPAPTREEPAAQE